MSTNEITIGSRTFRMQPLDALSQLAVAVKVLPVIPAIRPVLAAAAEIRERQSELDAASMEGRQPDAVPVDPGLSDETLTTLGTALNALGDEPRNFIIGTCLGAVLMPVSGGGFLPAWTTRLNTPDPSIDLFTMLRLVHAVILDNISSFSTALASK